MNIFDWVFLSLTLTLGSNGRRDTQENRRLHQLHQGADQKSLQTKER